MSSLSRALSYCTRKVLQAQALKTANFDSTGIDITEACGLITVTLKAMSYLGTSPTMLLKLQTCDTVGGSYEDVTGVTGTAAASTDLAFTVDKAKLKKFLAVNGVIGGTSTPSFVVSAEAHYFKKYI